jgi:hypothetical protein
MWKLQKGHAVAAEQVVAVAALALFPKSKSVVCLLLAMCSDQSLVVRLEESVVLEELLEELCWQ